MVEQLPNAQDLARNPVDVRWSDSTSDRADGGIAAIGTLRADRG